MYGIKSCHDCVDAEKLLKDNNIEFEYLDFAVEPVYLKEFIGIRDNDPFFNEVRKNGYIGIPYFVLEDGSKTLNIHDIVDK